MLHETLSSINLRAPQEDKTFVPETTIDVLFDYPKWLKEDKQITFKSDSLKGKSFAVIGAGASGLIAALELLKCGARVKIFEASDRIGGRMYSTYPDGHPEDIKKPRNVFELGCMRFPKSSVTFRYYMEQMGVPIPDVDFPDPGSPNVYAQLYYQNKLIEWPAPIPPATRSVPDSETFKKLGNTFPLMINYLIGNPNTVDQTPKENEGYLFYYWNKFQNGDQSAKSDLMKEWQNIIAQYWNTSFEQMIWDLSQDSNIVGSGGVWTIDDMNAFGALGMGSGGFGPLFPIGAIDMLRLLVDGLEYKQQAVPSGISTFAQRLAHSITHDFNGRGKIVLNRNLRFAQKEDKYSARNANVIWWQDLVQSESPPSWMVFDRYSRTTFSGTFDGVVLAVTTRAMEIMGLDTAVSSVIDGPKSRNDTYIIDQPCKTAVRNLHLTSSSKFFIETKTAFWEKKDKNGKLIYPSNIQSDELFRGLYCLKYKHRDREKAVVLVSYTWEDDSTKLMALTNDQKLEKFLVAIEAANPGFAEKLRDEMVGHIKVPNTIVWQLEKGYFGAFKLDYPGQEAQCQKVFLQYRGETPKNSGPIVLAGDSVSWMGGWIEGAVTSGVNAAAGIAEKVCPGSVRRLSPLDTDEVITGQYKYQPPFD